MNNWTIFVLLLIIISIVPFVSSSTVDFSNIPIKKQLEVYGILPEDVVCPNHIPIRIMKISDNAFACVKEQTSEKLVEREWGTRVVSTLCSDESGNLINHLVLVTDKKTYNIDESITITVKNCGNNKFTFTGTDHNIRIESLEEKILGSLCVVGEAQTTISPNQKESWVYSIDEFCFNVTPIKGEYWIYLKNTDDEEMYSINFT